MMSQRGEHHFTADDQRAVDGVSDIIDVSVINPWSMLPAYLQLAIYLRGAIIVRQLPPGSALPSEPGLVERYRVSRDTARKAIQLLREIALADRRGVWPWISGLPGSRTQIYARRRGRPASPDRQVGHDPGGSLGGAVPPGPTL
jgi:DNA-binding transcriptional MocR family regulator